jgi:hypothetical protein
MQKIQYAVIFFCMLVLALDFNKSLTQLEALQQQIISSLQNNDTMMKDVQTNVKQNLDAIIKNISGLETRIAALKKNER